MDTGFRPVSCSHDMIAATTTAMHDSQCAQDVFFVSDQIAQHEVDAEQSGERSRLKNDLSPGLPEQNAVDRAEYSEQNHGFVDTVHSSAEDLFPLTEFFPEDSQQSEDRDDSEHSEMNREDDQNLIVRDQNGSQ